MTDKQLAPLCFAMASFDAVAIANTGQPAFQIALGILLLFSYAIGFLAAFSEPSDDQ